MTAVAAVAPDELVTVVDLTHGTALMRLTGDRSAELLARETAVDLADRACPDGAALRTALAGLAVDFVRDDQAGVRSYLVGCERSSGQYLFDCLLESGADLGVDVDGLRAHSDGGVPRWLTPAPGGSSGASTARPAAPTNRSRRDSWSGRVWL